MKIQLNYPTEIMDWCATMLRDNTTGFCSDGLTKIGLMIDGASLDINIDVIEVDASDIWTIFELSDKGYKFFDNRYSFESHIREWIEKTNEIFV